MKYLHLVDWHNWNHSYIDQEGRHDIYNHTPTDHVFASDGRDVTIADEATDKFAIEHICASPYPTDEMYTGIPIIPWDLAERDAAWREALAGEESDFDAARMIASHPMPPGTSEAERLKWVRRLDLGPHAPALEF